MKISISEVPCLGKKIAQMLKPGKPLFLRGPLGVGKSTLARSIISSLCPKVDYIPSPSFPIMLSYPLEEGGILWHMDWYRLSVEDMKNLDFQTPLYHDLCLVEWPEKGGDLPFSFQGLWCTLDFTAQENQRLILLQEEGIP